MRNYNVYFTWMGIHNIICNMCRILSGLYGKIVMRFLIRRWVDFKNGDQQYLRYFLSLIQFITIIFALLIGNYIDMPIWLFAIIFISCYLVLGSLVGYIHRQKIMEVQLSMVFDKYTDMMEMKRDIKEIKEKLDDME